MLLSGRQEVTFLEISSRLSCQSTVVIYVFYYIYIYIFFIYIFFLFDRSYLLHLPPGVVLLSKRILDLKITYSLCKHSPFPMFTTCWTNQPRHTLFIPTGAECGGEKSSTVFAKDNFGSIQSGICAGLINFTFFQLNMFGIIFPAKNYTRWGMWSQLLQECLKPLFWPMRSHSFLIFICGIISRCEYDRRERIHNSITKFVATLWGGRRPGAPSWLPRKSYGLTCFVRDPEAGGRDFSRQHCCWIRLLRLLTRIDFASPKGGRGGLVWPDTAMDTAYSPRMIDC